MKFGGSSLASAERIREVAEIICSFPEHYPCIVLSAMGKTTNLLLQAGQEALRVAPGAVPSLAPLRTIRELHRRTAAELGMGSREDIESLLSEMQQLLVGISIMQELTARAQDSLVSFGERLSTRLFASYLRSQGVATRQHDAFSIGMTTTDDFQNADVLYAETLPALKAALARPPGAPRAIPIITGFLGRGINTGAITTLGRGGSDLTATVLGAALGVEEVQVWKDVDGVLTSDPRIVKEARPVPMLTFDEATELAFFGATVLHPSAMQPAMQVSSLDVRVKNSYNRKAAGTLISRDRDMTDVLMTSIVLKTDVTLMDIVSTRMLGQFGFLAQVFDVFRDNQISVDVVATSEISVSLTLDQSKIWERDLIEEEIQSLMSAFGDFAKVSCTHNVSIISLICNVAKTSSILERVFRVLGRESVNVKMMSQGASKTNISLIVADAEGRTVVQALHDEFF
ncbi:g7969 [Coccomyxa viridis]|uniref:Aspartokinase n=1 Tax=Coccomyxa viridis TaxID=1274662 RepID=A0ABP1G1P0_9CHLO